MLQFAVFLALALVSLGVIAGILGAAVLLVQQLILLGILIFLGSSLITFHSQNMTVAARAMAERNTFGQRS